jgi:hypothetical protein
MDLIDRHVSIAQMPGYMPIRSAWQQNQPLIDWAYLGDTRFTEPFFDDTIQRCLLLPFNQVFRPQTGIDALHELAASDQCLAPSAFIFHLSRCGSTLLSQMFAACESIHVISEASPIDRMLRADHRLNDLNPSTQIEWSRAMIRALGRKRLAPHQRYIIKFDAWHTSKIPLLQLAFPDVPWVFLYRDPLEVLVSNLNQRSGQMVPGAPSYLPPGVDLYQAMTMPVERYMALKLEEIMKAALAYVSASNGLLINYVDLPERALGLILQHFKIELSAQEYQAMTAATTRSAKQPSEKFVSDSAQKQASANELARHHSEVLLRPIYEQLEALRYRP